jgi:hypothetical protein
VYILSAYTSPPSLWLYLLSIYNSEFSGKVISPEGSEGVLGLVFIVPVLSV